MATKHKVEATKAVSTEGLERARITGALDMFEALFHRCGDPLLNGDTLQFVADHVGLPVGALCIEVARMTNDPLGADAHRLDELERSPMVKRIVWERASEA